VILNLSTQHIVNLFKFARLSYSVQPVTALLWQDNSVVDLVAMPSPERRILKEISKRLIKLLIIVILFRLF